AGHAALAPSRHEARALELRDQLLAQPELVVHLVGVQALLQPVRQGDETVLGVEHEVTAGPEHALQLAVEGLAPAPIEVADEAQRVDQVEAPGREGQAEAVAPDEPPREAPRARPPARIGSVAVSGGTRVRRWERGRRAPRTAHQRRESSGGPIRGQEKACPRVPGKAGVPGPCADAWWPLSQGGMRGSPKRCASCCSHGTLPAPMTAPEVTVIRDPARLPTLDGEWDDLLARSASDTVFLTWDWLRTWYEIYGAEVEPCVVLVREDGRLLAAAPLKLEARRLYGLRVRQLEFIGTGRAVCPDFLDLVIEAGREAELARVLLGALRSEPGWDRIALSDLPASSPVREPLEAPMTAAPLRPFLQVDRTCPYLTLPGP